MLTITTTHQPATDLGFLLHKHPDRLQSFDLPFGAAHVFYPEAGEERCTAAMMLEVDPIRLTRRGKGSSSTPNHLLQDYINDRPYAATSHLSSAIAKVYGTALSGKSNERPELAQQPIPLVSKVSSVRSAHGDSLIRRLFEPMGYEVETNTEPLDPSFPQWGLGIHHDITLHSEHLTLREALTHLYVLLPALDNEKHYWIGDDEVEKLMRFGEGWLAQHPAKAIISQRYLRYHRGLVNQAREQIEATEAAESEAETTSRDTPASDADGEDEPGKVQPPARERDLEGPMMLGEQRILAVLAALRKSGATSVLDLGCGEGQLLARLLEEPQLKSVTGLEVSQRTLEVAQRKLKPEQRPRVTLLHGSLTYGDKRLAGYDAAVAMEVVEHIDPPKLDAFREALLGIARPRVLIITTPNFEYNTVFDNPLPRFRHRDHRFEWTRLEFRQWAQESAQEHDYEVAFQGIGEPHDIHGHPTQMAIFTLKEEKTQ